MADKTIEWIHGVRAHGSRASRGSLYFSTGCSHAPHHVPKEWADKYKGKFDQGWDKLREETFARQKQLGVIPADAELTPRDRGDARLGLARREPASGSTRARWRCTPATHENADWNVGRVLDAIEEMGELDNTLVIYIWGDNGASMEGTLDRHVQRADDAERDPADRRAAAPARRSSGAASRPGAPSMMAPHYSAAWAWAGNSPFQWGKQVASHLGGTRDPMVVHWPRADQGRRAGCARSSRT